MNNSRIDIHENLCNELHDLYVSKNEDYGDSFRKVRNKFPTAILVRLHDKLNRLESLLGKDDGDRKVKDEPIDDTLMDIANYALLELVERRWDSKEDVEEDEEDEENKDDENNDFDKNHVNLHNEVFEIKGIRQKSSKLPYGYGEEDCWPIKTAIENVRNKLQNYHDSIVLNYRWLFIKDPNFEHIEVVGKRINNDEFIVYTIHFAKNWKITGFKMESIPANTGIIRLDINSNLIKDEKILNNIWYRKTRDSLFEPDGKDSFEWIIIPNIYGQDKYLFYKYYFDTTGALIRFKSDVEDKHIIENPIYFYIEQIFDNDCEEDEYVEED